MSFFDGNFEIEVSAASGIEAVAKRELLALGYSPKGANFGRICFDGSFSDVARANIFLRTASRVRIVLSRFECSDFDELYDGVKAVCVEELLPENARVVINAKSRACKLFALSAIQSVAKKAAVDALKQRYGLSTVTEDGEGYRFEVSIENDIATLTLDCSGEGLHKRGYRALLGDAPLRETLAAAMIMLSGWQYDMPLADPFCGSGTIPIEAAMIGLNIAPGINRNFAAERFAFAPKSFEVAREEAKAVMAHDRRLRISGFDINPDAVKLALRHASAAGVRDRIHLQTADMRQFSSRFKGGYIVTNPPYGQRLMAGEQLHALYRDFGEMCTKLDEWKVFVITACKSFERDFGRQADRTRKLYNSELECNFYQYFKQKTIGGEL